MKYKNELFTSNTKHLPAIKLNDQFLDIYDAVSKCTRCGYCLEVCPTYIIKKDEKLSPRGRNSIVRFLIEGKFKNVNLASPSIDTCLLCGACSDICYGEVPTSDIVLEAKREKTSFGKSILFNLILKIRKKQKIFDIIIKFLYLLHRINLHKIVEKLFLFEFLGFPSLSHASKKLFKPPLTFFHEKIQKHFPHNSKPQWIYFLTCGTDYLYPEIAKSTINVLNKIYGNGMFMKNTCCGMISYNYGKLEDAKNQAIENIQKYLDFKKEYDDFFIVLDCSSCAAFLKKYPQLLYDTQYYNYAVEFASKIKDVIEVIKPIHINLPIPQSIKNSKVTIHLSCKAYNDQKIKKQQEEVLKPLLGENLINMQEVMCCGGAGAYSITNPYYSEEILKRKIKNISYTHASYTLVSSTSCLMQLGYGARNYYPSTQIIHYIQFIDMITSYNN